MATPTISNIDPSEGLTGGETLVLITGTNFDLASTGEVEVYFDNVLSPQIRVRSSTEISCLTPRHEKGSVDVKVKNVAGGETVTETDGYTYKMPNLNSIPSEIYDCAKELKRILQIEVIDNVGLELNSTHTDFVDSQSATNEESKISSLPSITLFGPDFEENRFASTNTPIQTVDDNTKIYTSYHVPYKVDVIWELVGSARQPYEALQLHRQVINFFRRNEFIFLAPFSEDPNPDSDNYIAHELSIPQPGFTFMTPVEDGKNLFEFRGNIVVKAVGIYEDSAFVENKELGDITPSVPGIPFDVDIDLSIEKQ